MQWSRVNALADRPGLWRGMSNEFICFPGDFEFFHLLLSTQSEQQEWRTHNTRPVFNLILLYTIEVVRSFWKLILWQRTTFAEDDAASGGKYLVFVQARLLWSSSAQFSELAEIGMPLGCCCWGDDSHGKYLLLEMKCLIEERGRMHAQVTWWRTDGDPFGVYQRVILYEVEECAHLYFFRFVS